MKNLAKLSKKRLITYGDFADLYLYHKPYVYNFATKNNPKNSSESQRIKSENALARARQEIYRIIEANKGRRNSFVTLTFAENIKNLKMANRLFSKFLMRLKYNKNFIPKYLAVPEFQQRGAVHFHVVFFNFPYIHFKEIATMWGHGSVDIQESRKIHVLGAYVSKYLSKNTFDERLFRQKAYFTSRNLIRPELWHNEERIDNFLNSHTIDKVIQHKTYSSFGSNVVTIKKIKFKK